MNTMRRKIKALTITNLLGSFSIVGAELHPEHPSDNFSSSAHRTGRYVIVIHTARKKGKNGRLTLKAPQIPGFC